MKKNTFCLLLALSLSSSLLAQTEARWLRYPAISPDGSSIVFSYQGDLYKVPATGGTASLLTVHQAQDCNPVWSHDGAQIAFASDRYGNFDVYVMPAGGGTATRLTYHSSPEFPSDFSKDDGSVIYYSSQLDAASNQLFPAGFLPELYQISVEGGMPRQLLTTPAQDARLHPNGELLVYHDRKGYEDEFRKHHRSSITRDVWSCHLPTGKYTRLTDFEGEDRNPVVSPDGRQLYFLSERSGTFNVWKMDLSGKGAAQVTFFEHHPVRHLSISQDGLICFSYHGDLYTLRDGEKPVKLQVAVATGNRYNPEKIVSVTGNISEKGSSLRVSRGGIRRLRQGGHHAPHHADTRAGALRQLQSRWPFHPVCRRAQGQLEYLPDLPGSRGGKILFQRHLAEGKPGARNSGRGIPARLFA